MATAPNVKFVIKAPTDHMTSGWSTYIDYAARSLRDKQLSNVSPLQRGHWQKGRGYKWSEDASVLVLSGEPAFHDTDISSFYYAIQESGVGQWGLAQNSFGMDEIGIAQYDVSKSWWTYSYHQYNEYTCPVIQGSWMPNGSNNAPLIDIYPRMDSSKAFEINSIPYYFSPLILRLNGYQSITIYEYEHDNYAAFEENPAVTLTKRMEVPLSCAQDGPAQAEGYKWGMKFYPMGASGVFVQGFVNGYMFGFSYFSAIKRGDIPLITNGFEGCRYWTPGAGTVVFGQMKFPNSGNIISNQLSKAEEDDRYPVVTAQGFNPGDSSFASMVIDENGNDIQEGEKFQDYWYRVLLNPTTDEYGTPVIYDIKIDFEGELDEYIETGVDISADVVSMDERAGFEVGGYESTLRIRNKDGKYNYLIQRIMHEIDVDINDDDRAVLYTKNMNIDWYAAPRQENLFIDWECGDGWTKLQQQLCFNMPPFDGENIKDALSDFMNRLGWSSDRLDIDEIDFTLPGRRGAEDYYIKPTDGEEASGFLTDLHEKFFSTYIMRFSRDGKFQFKEPSEEIAEFTFYMGREGGQLAYDIALANLELGEDPPDPKDFERYIYSDSRLSYNYEDYRNEVWVFGVDEEADKVYCSMWVDLESQFDPYYPFYVGDRRITAVITKFGQQNIIDWIAENVVAWVSNPRIEIEIRTEFDPEYMPGMFFKVWPYDVLFRAIAIDTNLDPGNVSFGSGKMHGCSIIAQSWPTTSET